MISSAVSKTTDRKNGLLIYFIIWFLMIWNDQSISSFIVGCMVAHVVDKYGGTIKIWLLEKKLFWKAVILAVIIYMVSFQGDGAGIYHLSDKILKYAPCIRSAGWGAILIWIEIMYSVRNKRNSPKMSILTWLGSRLSPYIYAYHWPILLSAGCYIYIGYPEIKVKIRILVIAIICFALTLLISYIAFVTTLLIKRTFYKWGN